MRGVCELRTPLTCRSNRIIDNVGEKPRLSLTHPFSVRWDTHPAGSGRRGCPVPSQGWRQGSRTQPGGFASKQRLGFHSPPCTGRAEAPRVFPACVSSFLTLFFPRMEVKIRPQTYCSEQSALRTVNPFYFPFCFCLLHKECMKRKARAGLCGSGFLLKLHL